MSASDRNKVVVFVVDDQLDQGQMSDRTETYLKSLSLICECLKARWEFEIRLCGRPGALVTTNIKPRQPMLVVMDMVLDAPPWAESTVTIIDEWLFNHKIPTILVSEHFNEPAALARANKLMKRFAENKVPFQIHLWQSFTSAAQDKAIAEQLAVPLGIMLSMAQERDLQFEKGPNESINVLHITDPHFGVAKWDAGALAVLRGRFRDLQLAQADFLAITGDVSHLGTPSEYSLAREYFNSLSHNGLITGNSSAFPPERAFVVPGNHDFSRQIALAANITYSDDDRFSIDSEPGSDSDWVRLKARDPFWDFERELTGREKSWSPEPGFRIDSRFVGAGIVFLELDIERNVIKGYQKGASEEEIQKRLNDASEKLNSARQSGECIVVLAHRHIDDRWDQLGCMLNNFFAGLAVDGPVVLLCGHLHTAKVSSEFSRKLLLVRGVPALTGTSLPKASLPKLHYLELKRQGGEVLGASVYTFHQEVGEWLTGGNPMEFTWTQKLGWS